MAHMEKLLSGNDLRSLGKAKAITSKARTKQDFDKLFHYLFHKDRVVVMRAADTIEKITIDNPSFLRKHKKQIIALIHAAVHRELKWHLALVIPRLQMGRKEIADVWSTLARWVTDKNESRIVRVNSLQALFEMAGKEPCLTEKFYCIVRRIAKENVPSLKARIRLIRDNKSANILDHV